MSTSRISAARARSSACTSRRTASGRNPVRNVGCDAGRRGERVEVHRASSRRSSSAHATSAASRNAGARYSAVPSCVALSISSFAHARAVSWSPRRSVTHPWNCTATDPGCVSPPCSASQPRSQAAVLEHAVPVAGVEQRLEQSATGPRVRGLEPARLAERRHLLPHRLRGGGAPLVPELVRVVVVRDRGLLAEPVLRARRAAPLAGRRARPRRRACCGSPRGTVSASTSSPIQPHLSREAERSLRPRHARRGARRRPRGGRPCGCAACASAGPAG